MCSKRWYVPSSCVRLHDCYERDASSRIRRIHLQKKKKIMTYRWLPSRRMNGNPWCRCHRRRLYTRREEERKKNQVPALWHIRKFDVSGNYFLFESPNLLRPFETRQFHVKQRNESFLGDGYTCFWPHFEVVICVRQIIHNSHSSLCQFDAIMEDFLLFVHCTVSFALCTLHTRENDFSPFEVKFSSNIDVAKEKSG